MASPNSNLEELSLTQSFLWRFRGPVANQIADTKQLRAVDDHGNGSTALGQGTAAHLLSRPDSATGPALSTASLCTSGRRIAAKSVDPAPERE